MVGVVRPYAPARNDPLSYQSQCLVDLPSYNRNLLVRFGFLLLSGWLVSAAGCTGLPRTGPAEGGFHLRGKMGVVQGEESFSARFLWQQEGRRFTIDLWGPLGQGRLRLVGDRRRLELREGDGTLISRGTPEEVMLRHLGWTLPLSVLPQWVRGRTAAGLPAGDLVRDEAGHLEGFAQVGWQVDLERYREVKPEASSDSASAPENPVFLPHRVTARRDAYRVRLAISEWRI